MAANFLTGLQTSTQEELDFIFTQNLNLERLVDHEFEPDSIDLVDLYTIGSKTDPLAGYARSLYHYFTGEKIDLGLEDDDELNESRIIQKNGDATDDQVKLFPNPFSDFITVEYSLANDSRLEIFNAVGQLVWSEDYDNGEGSETIDMSKMKPGIYLIVIKERTTEKTIFAERMIKQ